MTIGKTIRNLRRKREMTQASLAKKTGLSQTAITFMERGKSSPTPNNLKAISKALNVPVPLIYAMAATPSDVPVERREQFKKCWQDVVDMAAAVFFDDPKNLE